MLTNYKIYLFLIVLIGSLSYSFITKQVNNRLENKLQLCNANYAVLQDKVKTANDIKEKQEKMLRLREQEAAQARVESQRRMEFLMKENVPQECNGAIQWMIAKAR
jgi:hypothetical protein